MKERDYGGSSFCPDFFVLPDEDNMEAMTVNRDARWDEIQRISDAIARRDATPTELEAALCGAVWRAREWKKDGVVQASHEGSWQADVNELGGARRVADELRSALKFLYEQVCSLEDYTVTRDLDKYKAEAVFDDAVEQARKALL